MRCQSCGYTVFGQADRCPACGEPLGTDGESGPVSGRTVTEESGFVTDGGHDQPADEDDTGSEPNGDDADTEYLDAGEIVDDDIDDELPGDEQPRGEPGDQPPTGGPGGQPPAGPGEQPPDQQPPGEQSPGGPAGQPPGDQPLGERPGGQQPGGQQPPAGQQPSGQPAGGQQPPAGQPAQQPGTEAGAVGEQDYVEQLKALPLLVGGILGALAMLIPFGLLSVVTFVTNEQDVPINSDGDIVSRNVADSTMGPLDVSTEALFEFLQFGSGERVRDLFLASADTDLSTVAPADYPTWDTELQTLLPLVRNSPEIPMLVLYIIAPYILFVSSRFLARHYAPGQEPLDYVKAGVTLVVGTLPIVLILGLAFNVTDMMGAVLVGGLVVPVVIGALGGLTIYGFDDHSTLYSTLFGWATILLGVVIAFLLSPFSTGSGGSPDLETTQQFVVGLGGYLSTMRLDIVDGSEGQLLAVAVVVTILGAGFLRTWMVKERVTDETDGARVGASLFLGFVRPMALLLWAFSMIVVFVDFELGSLFSVGLIDSVVSGSGDYLTAILIAGVALPMALGAAGGYLAIWVRDRNQPTQPPPRQRPR